jgi:cell wall-associated NlpC family hydrolase
MKLPYVWGGGHQAGWMNLTKASALKGLDCSGSVCWVLHQAGMFPASAAAVSGDLEAWGQAGPGRSMTVWAAGDHVFIEFHPKGGSHMQLNTSVPGQNGPRYVAWGPRGSTDAASGAFVARHWPGT